MARSSKEQFVAAGHDFTGSEFRVAIGLVQRVVELNFHAGVGVGMTYQVSKVTKQGGQYLLASGSSSGAAPVDLILTREDLGVLLDAGNQGTGDVGDYIAVVTAGGSTAMSAKIYYEDA